VAARSATVDQLWTELDSPVWHGRESGRPLVGIIAAFAGDRRADHRPRELVTPEYGGLPVKHLGDIDGRRPSRGRWSLIDSAFPRASPAPTGSGDTVRS
jgi:hypothetical protein